MNILGIDPGYGRVGWGVINYDHKKAYFTACECIITDAKLPFTTRLEQVFDEVNDIIKRHGIDELAVESIFFNTNTKTAMLASQARGVILLAGIKAKIPVFDYTPLQVKQALIGYGRADKKQIQTMLQFHLQMKEIITQDDAADALAIALTHAYTNQRLK